MLTLAFVALAPAGGASSTCVSVKGYGCPGTACADVDGDGTFGADECVDVRDADPCRFQSDCCPSTGVWCPEYPPER